MNKTSLFKIVGIIICLVLLISVIYFYNKNDSNKMIDLTNKSLTEVKEYANKNYLNLTIKSEYNNQYEKDHVISQSISKNTVIKKNQNLIVIVSLGKIDKDLYKKYNVNELGRIPIMMYHGINNIKSSDTAYIGGNVDKAGYQRTAEAFKKDLDFYYQNGYRMISLIDYVNGIIDVPIGKSPIILTFDDGLKNNIKVTGLDSNGNIIIDPNSAVGIMETYKQKYPDFNITATFFLNGELFGQQEYNEKIINWLIDHNYDIGNHSLNHVDFTSVSKEQTEKEIGLMYQKLSTLTDKYINIVALPYGSPYDKKHPNFEHILKGKYQGISYETISTLRVGWESDYSPFSKDFDKTFLKRIRAYDNNGLEFDIKMNFKILKNNRYISDGDKNKITIKENQKDEIKNKYNLEVITY